MRKLVLAVALGLSVIPFAFPVAGAELQPTPGQVLIINKSTLTASGCEPKISIRYAFMPIDNERGFSAVPDANCIYSVA